MKNSEESIMNEKCGIDVMLRDEAKGRYCLLVVAVHGRKTIYIITVSFSDCSF